MRGKLEGIREGVSPWGGRPSKVKRTVNVLCQQNNLLRMKPGLKSYLLSRLFPTVCSGELHSCGAGEGRRGWASPPRRYVWRSEGLLPRPGPLEGSTVFGER